MKKKSHVLKESEREYTINNFQRHKVLIANMGESGAIKRELDDGNYVIFQLGQGWLEPHPVFAFKVENSNFKIVSVFGSKDLSNLAAQIWYFRFKNHKAVKTIKLINELRKELDKIEEEMHVQIKRDPYYKKKSH